MKIILARIVYITIFLFFLTSCSNRTNNDSNETNEQRKISMQKLGEMLFFDKSLSLNKTQSCATCHNPDHAFIDDRDNALDSAVSLGDDGVSLGDRNAPTISYAKFSPTFHFDNSLKEYIGGQFFDGRAEDLKAQAKAPPLNPVEMGMPDIQSLVARIKQNGKYVEMFKTIFAEDIFDDANKTYDAMAQSIAEFEKTEQFAPFDSKYDKYLKGEYKLTPKQKLGMDLFFANGATNCIRCHTLKKKGEQYEPFSGYGYHNIGTPVNKKVRYANSLPLDFIDHGLLANPLVKDTAEDGKFKVPTLRNIAVTAPYMHNGIFKNLRTVLEFYDHFNNPKREINPETGKPWGEPEVNATVNREDLRMQILTDEKIDALIAFLKLLTDERYEHLIENSNDVPPDNIQDQNETQQILFQRFGTQSFTMPVGLLQAPRDNNRWYVIELEGKVQTFKQNEWTKKIFIDISEQVKSGGEQGLLGMAFHPEFPTVPYVFLSYIDLEGNSVIARFTSDDEGSTLNVNSKKIILTLTQPYENHNGGNIAFGADGYLYIGFGDGGSAFDPHNNAQNKRTLLGSMLRIDIDNADPYAIVEDNPFFGNPKAVNGVCQNAECPEIYAWGFRNPWRWSFDKRYGRLWVGDVGQDNWEEVDIVEKGKNYGWNCKEGTHKLDIACNDENLTDPVLEYDHNQGFAITGGYVYRGQQNESLKGVYIYADYVTAVVWGYFPNGDIKVLADTEFSISSFGEGNDGELYIVDFAGGNLYKINEK